MGGTDGSPGSTTGRHHRDEERSWLEMLAADDDVEDPSLLRAPDLTTRGGESPDAPVLDDDRLRLRPLGWLGDDDIRTDLTHLSAVLGDMGHANDLRAALDAAEEELR